MKYNNTIIPSIILYQPNALKSFFLIYFNSNLIENNDTINAVIMPNASTINSVFVKFNPKSNNFTKEAPNITGNANINEYSVITTLFIPSNNPPTIVAPLLDVPGIIDNT